MKRWITLAVILLVLITACFLLMRTATEPDVFTGIWYGAENGQLYQFRDGIITSSENTGCDGSGFCGAYTFCKDRILLFTVDEAGQSRLRELYPAGESKGEFLSETADGAGRIVFSRSNIAEQSKPAK